MAGRLFLIPSAISDSPIDHVIPGYIKEVVSGIKHYIVENERTARRMLIRLGIATPVDDLRFYILNKHTSTNEIPGFLEITKSEDVGLLSEAGVPGVADPGSEVVMLAHKKNIRVIPLAGPSSILLALMASGLNGQNFAFVGYLPVKSSDRIRKIKEIENRSGIENQSQLFIEAPYRNNQMLNDILKTCSSSTLLCIAMDLTNKNEFIQTRPIDHWKKNRPEMNRKPAIFIIHKKN
ncbi:MAG: SAM-dependent methyltransferase [Bacteroidales bacterium]|jgi:16S rRNA (cytidine1402-2'-O)-methyltransferase